MIKKNNIKTKGYLFVAIAGICWGTTGTLAKSMMELGVNAQGISFIRMFFGCMSLLIYMGLKNKNLLKIDAKGLVITAVMGLVTQTGFNFAFFNAIDLIGVASATVLLYLSPIFLLVWSVLFFKEKLNNAKLIGVSICVLGSYLAITDGTLDLKTLSLLGVLLGIASALSYSLVSVFSKLALEKYHSETIVVYSFMFGFIFTMPFIPLENMMALVGNYQSLLLAFGLGTISSSVAYVFYFNGIATGIELSKAGVISILELIVSIVFSVVLLGENLSLLRVVGIVIIVCAIVIIQNSDAYELCRNTQNKKRYEN